MKNKRLIIGLPIILAVTLFLWYIPSEWLGMKGLTIVQQRTLALFAFAALMWMVEFVPNWVTSVLIIVLSLLTISTNSLKICLATGDDSQFVSSRNLMASFADPVIMLFLGGFVLAIVANKYGMDTRLARVLMRPFGHQPKWVLLGVLMVIALFSMFMSNTATAAMFLTFLAPVLASLPEGEKGKVGLALAIPIAANLGGIGTPIGTPPNATAVGILAQHGIHITFGNWAMHMIPFVLIMILIAWRILLRMFPFDEKEIRLQIESKTTDFPLWRRITAWAVCGLTIVLWMTEQWTGLSASVVALIPLAIYSVTGIFDEKDIHRLDWNVLWLVAGGFALGTAMGETGLANTLVSSINFSAMNIIAIVIVAGLLCYALSNFISNSATAALLIPIVVVVGEGLLASPVADAFIAHGGQIALNIFVAMAASLAMILPISTPPNAMATSTRLVSTSNMAKVGMIIGVIGFILGYFWLTTIMPF